MTGLPQKIVAIHRALDRAGLAHAFGGALALAWCTERARGTIDVDLNVFVAPSEARSVVAGLPKGVAWSEDDVATLERDGQTRLWWDSTPVDVFLDTTDFHRAAAGRARFEPFAGAEIPFLGCSDLAVFKAFFNRTKDWADLEEMVAVGSLDVERVLGVLVRHLGADDERVARLNEVAARRP
jgi:hypothetical protein